jgi:flagellar motor switch protein FliG
MNAQLAVLSGPQKSAILCMALGTEVAARVMQALAPHEVELLTREIASTPVVKADVVEAVMREYREMARAVEQVARGGVDVAREILEQALGPNRARPLLERIQEQLSEAGLTQLRRAAPDVLTSVLRGEHPQTIALILAHLDPRQAAAVIQAMDPELASDALYRVGRMEKISPEMLQLVEAGLGQRTDLSLAQEMTSTGGPATVAKVLNFAPTSLEKTLLEQIASRNAELAQQIRNLMFTFEDLRLLDSRAMQRLLREIDNKELALALKAASDELKQHIMSNMSERAAETLREEIEYMGPVRVRDVEAAHTRIIETVRRLEEAGELVIAGKAAEDDIIA